MFIYNNCAFLIIGRNIFEQFSSFHANFIAVFRLSVVLRQSLLIKWNLILWNEYSYKCPDNAEEWGQHNIFQTAMDIFFFCCKGHTEKEYDNKCWRICFVYLFFFILCFLDANFINQESQQCFRFASNMAYWFHQLF